MNHSDIKNINNLIFEIVKSDHCKKKNCNTNYEVKKLTDNEILLMSGAINLNRGTKGNLGLGKLTSRNKTYHQQSSIV